MLMNQNRRIYISYTILIGLSLIAWEIGSRSFPSARLLLSSPLTVVKFIHENAYELMRATWITWIEAFLGLIIAVTASLALFSLTLFFPAILRLLMPAMIASQVIPLIVLAPFFVLAFGVGISSKVAMAAVLCFFPIFVGLAQGFRLIAPNVHDLLDVFNAPRSARISLAYLPLAMPSGMAGLKVSATLSIIGAIVAEFTGSETGLGRNLFLSTIRLQPDLMMASLAGSALLGFSMYLGVAALERKLGFWYLHESFE